MDLIQLAEKYYCEKLHCHSYVPFYQQLFEPLRQSVTRVIEIGVGHPRKMARLVPKYIHGASLKLWRDYFPNATVYGLDNEPEAMVYGEPRIQTMFVDQSKAEELSKVLELAPVDIIIDDGSHNPKHQILSAQILQSALRPGGLYIIEDIRELDEVFAAVGGELHQWDRCLSDRLLVIKREEEKQ